MNALQRLSGVLIKPATLTIFKMKCQECDWMVIATSQRACNREALKHPHYTMTQIVDPEDLRELEIG